MSWKSPWGFSKYLKGPGLALQDILGPWIKNVVLIMPKSYIVWSPWLRHLYRIIFFRRLQNDVTLLTMQYSTMTRRFIGMWLNLTGFFNSWDSDWQFFRQIFSRSFFLVPIRLAVNVLKTFHGASRKRSRFFMLEWVGVVGKTTMILIEFVENWKKGKWKQLNVILGQCYQPFNNICPIVKAQLKFSNQNLLR